MARERPGHVHAGQDLVPRQPDAFPEGHHPVRVHGVPAVEEDDLVAFHDRADAEEGREVEHEVGAAVDQVILPRSNGPRIRSRVGTRVVRAGRVSRRASGTTMGCATSAIANPPRIRWGRRYKVGGGGEGWAKVLGDASARSYFYPDRSPCRRGRTVRRRTFAIVLGAAIGGAIVSLILALQLLPFDWAIQFAPPVVAVALLAALFLS